MIQNGIEYERRGEQYYPLFDLGEQTSYEIGKYGNLHLDFLKKHRRGTYTTLYTENRLNEHLHNIDLQAHEQLDPRSRRAPPLCYMREYAFRFLAVLRLYRRARACVRLYHVTICA